MALAPVHIPTLVHIAACCITKAGCTLVEMPGTPAQLTQGPYFDACSLYFRSPASIIRNSGCLTIWCLTPIISSSLSHNSSLYHFQMVTANMDDTQRLKCAFLLYLRLRSCCKMNIKTEMFRKKLTAHLKLGEDFIFVSLIEFLSRNPAFSREQNA